MKIRISLLLVCLSYGFTVAAQDAKPRIAIKTFENPVAYQNSTIGNALTEILTTELGKTGKFRILEREAVAELLKEFSFGKTDPSKSPPIVSIDGFKGADFLLLGKVTNFGFKEETNRVQVTTNQGLQWVTVYQQEADVRVDFRMVSTKTGEAVLTEAGKGHKTNTSYNSELAIWNHFIASGASITTEFSSSLIGRATEEAVRDVVRKLSDLTSEVRDRKLEESIDSILKRLGETEGRILAELGQEVFVVNLGSDSGVTKGDRLKVFSEILTRNKKGDVIYWEQREAGSLEVIDVSMKDRAKARFLGDLSGGNPQASPPREGDIVKIDLEYARTLRGTHPTSPGEAGQPGGQPGNAADYQAFLKKGDRYLEDEHYAQALEQYQKALLLKPNDPKLLDRMAEAHLSLRDFEEVGELAEKILGQGAPLTVPVAHRHFGPYCVGNLVIEKGQLSFRTKKGEHDFNLVRSDIVQMQEGVLPHSNLPSIVLRWRGQDGKEKKYDFLFYLLLKKNSGTPPMLDEMFSGDAQSIKDTTKAIRIFLRLVQEYVK